MKNRVLFLWVSSVLMLLCCVTGLQAQNGSIKGRVFDPINNEAVPFAVVAVMESTTATTTDIDGRFELTELKPGLYNLRVSSLGFQTREIYEVEVTTSKAANVDVELEPSTEEIEEVEVSVKTFSKTTESPVSLRTIGVNEIKRYPGGNRDISKVIQSLPGVASTVSFRNDILIRGGSPAENRFYLDGIEVPNINHFSTQGATGGPVGLLNVDFIKKVDFYSSAFPANRGNSLSSVMEIGQLDGREDRLGFTFTLGASETALSLEGPLSKNKKSTFMVSARRSYLQFLFKLFELPFLPTYTDVQFKTKLRLNDRNQLTILGLAAVDRFELNLDANETPDQQYLLDNLPDNDQWNYTFGLKHTLFTDNSYWTFVASRNHLNNSATKYRYNDDSSEDNLLLDYESQEIENKLRIENTARKKGYRINYGIGYELAQYTNTSFIRKVSPLGEFTVDYDSELFVHKWSGFAQVSRGYVNERLNLSLGIRMDGSDYNKEMRNPFKQFSPRFSLAYAITPNVAVNFNTGVYYQLPPYTSMGFRNNAGVLVNRDNGLKYIRGTHVVGGLEYNTEKNSKVTAEAFFKKYGDYPFLLEDSISLANLGGDFGVIGNEEVRSISEGRAYGLELLFQQKLYRGWYGIVAYTFYRSEFKDKNGAYVPSSWDSRHIISLTGGKKFNKNWEVGAVWKVSGGSPYTPFDESYSSLISVWDINNEGVPDYDLLNSERLPWFHQLDIRVDKKFFFNKWAFEIYLDIQNLYNFEATIQPYMNANRDTEGRPLVDPDDPTRYDTYIFEDKAGQLLPSVGVVISY